MPSPSQNTSETIDEFATLLDIDLSGVVMPDTRLVDAAARDVAKLYDRNEWPRSVSELLEYENIDDGSVPVQGLLDLLEERGHCRRAGAWAVFRLLECDRLLGRSIVPSCRDRWPSSGCRDSVALASYTDKIYDEAGGELNVLLLVRPASSLWDWYRYSPGAAPTLGENATHEGGHRTDTEQRGAPAQYYLKKLGENKVLVRFGREEDTITGKGALRIYRLISQGQVHALELGGDLEALQDRSSAVPYEEASDLAAEGRASFGIPRRDSAAAERLRVCAQRMKELRADIEAAETSDAERQEHEEELAKLRDLVREFVGDDSKSQIRRARQRVDRDLRGQIGILTKSMPRFAQHLRASKGYDEAHDQYVYRPAEKPPWKFKNFG